MEARLASVVCLGAVLAAGILRGVGGASAVQRPPGAPHSRHFRGAHHGAPHPEPGPVAAGPDHPGVLRTEERHEDRGQSATALSACRYVSASRHARHPQGRRIRRDLVVGPGDRRDQPDHVADHRRRGGARGGPPGHERPGAHRIQEEPGPRRAPASPS